VRRSVVKADLAQLVNSQGKGEGMTSRQVFEWFIKKHQLKGYVVKAFLDIDPIEYSINRCIIGVKQDRTNTPRVSFKNYLDENFKRGGFHDLMYYVFDTKYKMFMKKSERFKKAMREWKKFSKYHIKVKESSLKVGDIVTVNLLGVYNMEMTGTVTEIYDEFCVFNFMPNESQRSSTYRFIRFSKIVSVNGHEPDIRYEIKENRKRKAKKKEEKLVL